MCGGTVGSRYARTMRRAAMEGTVDLANEHRELAAWVEEVTGGRIVSAERQGRWRAQWFVRVSGPNGEADLVVRMPRDPAHVRDMAFTSRYDTRHEGDVLRSLEGQGIPIPRCHGFHEATESLLIDEVGGSADFADLSDPATRSTVLREYIRNLVRLHELDPADFPAIGELPVDAQALALGGQLRWMRQDFERFRPHIRPEPLLEFALWWLTNNFPTGERAPAVIQGDTGPGQFMFVGDQLTALIDWELADIGDPMMDLGVMRMRNTLYPMGDIAELIDCYGELAGRSPDLDAIRYYTVMAAAISPLGMCGSMQNPDAAIDSMLPRFAWDASMRRCLCEAMLEALGEKPLDPEMPAPIDTSRTTLHDFLVDHLDKQCVPLARDDYEQYLLGGAAGIARALRLADQVGPALDAADLDDIASVLGTRPRDRHHGDELLMAVVRERPDGDPVELLQLWFRMAVRREWMWTPLMVAQGSARLEPIA
jgi:aminoglycoside phosphotransferase (APT) family kinase protein